MTVDAMASLPPKDPAIWLECKASKRDERKMHRGRPPGKRIGGRGWGASAVLFLVMGGLVACVRTVPPTPATSPPAPETLPKPVLTTSPPAPIDYARIQEGVASWYGPDFHGKTTSSGETYDMYQLTAAHPTLPMGTRVRVTRLENHRTVAVKINDRGPFLKGRILDLSYAAARVLDMVDQGTAQVRLEVLDGPSAIAPGDFSMKPYYTLQLGAFTQESNAMVLKGNVEVLLGKGLAQVFPVREGLQDIFRVRVGTYIQREAALVDAQLLARNGFVVLVVAEYP